MQFRVASFNLGIHQTMIQPGQAKQHTIEAHLMNLQRVCAKIVDVGHVDLFFGCEVGGAGEGFRRAGMNVHDILSGPFGENFCVHEDDKYIAVFAFAASVSVCLHDTPRKFTFKEGRDVDVVIT